MAPAGVKLFFSIGILLLMLTIASCKKQGCTDSGSLNYCTDAEEDDGSCTYAADIFVGEYEMHCVRIHADMFGVDTAYFSNEKISICKSDSVQNQIQLFGIISGTADVNGDSLTIKNKSGVGYISTGGAGVVRGDSLFVFDFFSSAASGTTTTCVGNRSGNACNP